MEASPYCTLNKKGNKLLKDKRNVELPEEYREVSLPAHKATFNGDVETLQLIFFALADEGVPLNDTYGSTPLHLAAKKDDAKVAKWLLDYTDIDPTAKAKKGETAFHVAAVQGSLKAIEVMVSHDSSLKEFVATSLDDSCFTALHLAIIRHHNHIVRFLISKLGNKAIGSMNESGINTAHVAASVGNVEALKLIFNKNKKILHHVAKDLTSPVFFAAQEGHFNALQYLHQKGKCELASRSFDGMNPIHAACQNGHLEIIQYITSKLGKSATFDQTPDGSTPLHFAAGGGHEEIVRWLINNDLTGTIAFIQDNSGDTPAHDAADNGHTEILKILLENGADIHAANNDGFTPYALASQGPHEDTAAFAVKYAAATSHSDEEAKPSKMNIFDLENAQKGKDSEQEDSQTEISPYDSMSPAAKDENEPNEKLLEWNKEEIGLFEENKIKPSHLTSPTTQEYEKRTAKRQARKTPKSIKDHITQTVHVELFKPNMNVNPLVDSSSKTDGEEEPTIDVDALYAKPDPEVVKRKSMKKTEANENVTAVVNEYFDEEEPQGDDEPPNPPPEESMTTDDTKEDNNKNDISNDNTTDMEPLVKSNKNTPVQKVGDEVADVKPSRNNDSANEDKTAGEDDTAEIQATIVNEEQTVVTEQETVATETTEKEGEDINGDEDNVPLIDVKKSATEYPTSPGKFGLKHAKRKDHTTFTAPNQDSQSGASDELKKAFARRSNK